MPEKPIDIRVHNRAMWDAQVERGNQWTLPVDSKTVEAARRGEWSVVLTPFKTVPSSWWPASLDGCRILCLASGGGQQGPVLAAAGAQVTVYDNSPRQLGQDRLVAERDGLTLETVEGDMRDLSAFEEGQFDLIFHPCSNTFVPDIRPVWREAYRVLRPGGEMLSGFCNPLIFLFEEGLGPDDPLVVKYRIPYSDLESLTDAQRAELETNEEALCFGHTLEDQIDGQLEAGFLLKGFYEDDRGPDSVEPICEYIKGYIATRAVKLS